MMSSPFIFASAVARNLLPGSLRSLLRALSLLR